MKEKGRIISDRNAFYTSLFFGVYFSFLHLNALVLKMDFVLIGVLQEMLTIPFILIQFILLIYLVVCFFKNNSTSKIYFYLSLSILLIINIFIIGSFWI